MYAYATLLLVRRLAVMAASPESTDTRHLSMPYNPPEYTAGNTRLA